MLMEDGHNKILTVSFFFFFNRSNLLNWAYTGAQKNPNLIMNNMPDQILSLLFWGKNKFIAVVGLSTICNFSFADEAVISH